MMTGTAPSVDKVPVLSYARAMTIRVLIVDDEAPARDELAFLLAGHDDVRDMQAATAGEALEILEGGDIDLVFQDIQMPGMGGFQILELALEMERTPLFVFVTAYDQYAVQAFEAEALDYLLKPVSEKRLANCLDRARQRLGNERGGNGENETLRKLLRELRGTTHHPIEDSRFPLIRGGRIRLTPARDVLLFEVDGKRILARMAEGPEDERLPLHNVASMAALEERLEGYPFVRIGRSSMVNLERIAEVAPYHSGKYIIVLDDPARTQVTVGRGRAAELKQRLGLA